MATEEVIAVEIQARGKLTNNAGPSESIPLELNYGHDKWLDSVVSAGATKSKGPCIPKVPKLLRDTKDFGKHYDARVVSLGPYHLGKSNLQTIQKLKSKIALKFVGGKRDALENLFYKVLKLCQNSNLSTWYEESCNKNLTEDAFARMMVLDGCFILYYIECVMRSDPKPEEELEMNIQEVDLVQQDMFLLENQLPFCVLEVLMLSITSYWRKETYMSQINAFIKKYIWDWNRPELKKEKNCGKKGICWMKSQLTQHQATSDPPTPPQATWDTKHLLQHLQKQIVGSEESNVPSQATMGHQVNNVRSQATKSQSNHCNWCKKDKKLPSESGKERYTFRNLDELLEVGIHCRLSQSSNLRTAVKYNDEGIFRTYLELPPIVVDDSTKARLLNLIAYEMCSLEPQESWVTSYVCFLDTLIDDVQDVKILRKAEIVENCLGSDQEVSQLFNDIGHDLVPYFRHYSVQKAKIQKHYKCNSKTWMAQLNREYFKNPWSIFALIATIVVLLLTGVQTYFGIWPLPSDCDGLCKNLQKTHHL